MRVVVAFVSGCLLACSGPSQSDAGSGGGSAIAGGGVAGGTTAGGTAGGGSAGGIATAGGTTAGGSAGGAVTGGGGAAGGSATGGGNTSVDAGRWPVSFGATDSVTSMVALDSGDLIVGLQDVATAQGAILRLAVDGNVTWRYPMTTRIPGVIDVSRNDRIVVFANSPGMFHIVVLNPDGTLRREVSGNGRGTGRFDRNEVVWFRESRLDDTGAFTASRLGADLTWTAGQTFDVEDFIVALGSATATSSSLRAIELDGGVRWNLPVTLSPFDGTMDVYQTAMKLGASGAAYVGLASRAGDGGILTLNVGCGAAGPYSLSAIDQGVCLWTRAWNPGSTFGQSEFAPTPDGVVSWNGSALELYDARDGGMLRSFGDGGVLKVAASRVSQTIYFQDGARRLLRAR